MNKLKVPNSLVEISQVGFGCARLSGGLGLRVSESLIEEAVSFGITHFDTAPLYGSEKMLGIALKNIPNITITSKVGIARQKISFKSEIITPIYRNSLRRVLTYHPILKSKLIKKKSSELLDYSKLIKTPLEQDYILRELELTLNNLRREYVDLYLIHEPDFFYITDETVEIFESLKRQRIIGAYGLAYNSSPFMPIKFGSVLQCRYPQNSLESTVDIDCLKIFHGLIRHSNDSEVDSNPNLIIKNGLLKHPNSGILFSSSSNKSIREVMTE